MDSVITSISAKNDRKRKNKKGVSTLIATVIIVLITLAAVGIIWQVVIPLVRTGMETTRVCSNVQLTIDKESSYTFSNDTHVSVMVSGAMISGGELEFKELNGTQIKVYYDGKSETFDTRTDLGAEAAANPAPGINEEWTYVIPRSLIGGGTGVPSGVAVAPIVRIGGKDRVCHTTGKHYYIKALQYAGTPQNCSDKGGVECCTGSATCPVGNGLGTAMDCSTVCCAVSCCPDSDGDGYAGEACGGNDCDDANATINPGAIETCGNGIDEDCVGGDLPCPTCPEGATLTRCDCGGVVYESGYCCAGVYQTDPCPGAVNCSDLGGVECCDNVTYLCVGTSYPGASDCLSPNVCCSAPCCIDSDGDGYANETCGGDDCNDANPNINPDASEICGNGIDEDCNGVDLPCAGITCSDYWGFDCGAGPPESGDNTFDDCGNGKGSDESVEEIYLNATTISYGEALNVTCEFDPYTSGDDTYISYYNGSAWFVLYSHTNWGSASITNESVVFVPNSTTGQHWVRCSITYYSDQGTHECMNPSTDDYYDNDDLGFSVT